MSGREQRPSLSRLTAASLVLAAALLGPGCAVQDWRFETHRERAAAYVEAGQRDLALIELYSALRIHPDHPEVNFGIAELESRRLNSAAALFFYRETHASDPENVEAAVKLALLILADEPHRGRELVEEAAQREPQNPWTSIGLSEVALVRGDTFYALEAAREAIRSDRESSAARWQLARVHFAMIRERSLQGRRVVASQIEDARLAILAYSKRAPDDKARAVVEYARVIGLTPSRFENASKWFAQGIVEARRTDRPELERYAAREALRFARDYGFPELRISALRSLTRVDTEDLSVWKELSEVSPLGRDAVFENLLEALPEDPGARMLIVQQRLEDDGLDWARSFLLEQAADGVDPALLLGFLADLQLSAGLEKDWEETSRKLIAEQHQHPRARVARAHLALTRPEPGTSPEDAALNAAEILRPIVAFEENAPAEQLLAISESQLGNHARALDAIGKAIAITGPSLERDRVHAMILHEAGYWKYALTLLLRVRARVDLTDAEQLMLGRCAYRSGKDVIGRRMVMLLLAKDDPPAGAAVELAEHEVPDPRLVPKIMRSLRAEIERGTRDQRVIALATALDLERGNREPAISRLTRQFDRDIAVGVRAQQQARGQRGDERDRTVAEARRARNRVAGLARYATTLRLESHEIEKIVGVLRAARASGMLEPRGHAWLGRLQLRTGHEREARASFERALAEGFDDAWLKNELALLLARNGIQLERALQLAQEANAEVDNADALDTLGFVHLRSGDGAAALEHFDRALDLSKDTPRADFQYHRGLALQALGQSERAAAAFDTALRLDPDLRDAADALAELERTAIRERPRKAS